MIREHSSAGDPARSLDLLWRDPAAAPRTRGPKPGLSVARIVEAAVRLADAEGLGGISMRRLAEDLGVGTMSLYTYVPGKAELADLMVDSAHGELYRQALPAAQARWRGALTEVARENLAVCRRHRWLLELGSSRPPLGPHTVAKYEAELAAVAATGLDDVEMDAVVALVVGHAQNTARAAADAERIRQDSGQSDEQWWRDWGPRLERIMDPERYPLATRVGAAVGAEFHAAVPGDHGFAFGLERILDGVEHLIAQRATAATAPPVRAQHREPETPAAKPAPSGEEDR